jgi:hypothetical protein
MSCAKVCVFGSSSGWTSCSPNGWPAWHPETRLAGRAETRHLTRGLFSCR